MGNWGVLNPANQIELRKSYKSSVQDEFALHVISCKIILSSFSNDRYIQVGAELCQAQVKLEVVDEVVLEVGVDWS